MIFHKNFYTFSFGLRWQLAKIYFELIQIGLNEHWDKTRTHIQICEFESCVCGKVKHMLKSEGQKRTHSFTNTKKGVNHCNMLLQIWNLFLNIVIVMWSEYIVIIMVLLGGDNNHHTFRKQHKYFNILGNFIWHRNYTRNY